MSFIDYNSAIWGTHPVVFQFSKLFLLLKFIICIQRARRRSGDKLSYNVNNLIKRRYTLYQSRSEADAPLLSGSNVQDLLSFEARFSAIFLLKSQISMVFLVLLVFKRFIADVVFQSFFL